MVVRRAAVDGGFEAGQPVEERRLVRLAGVRQRGGDLDKLALVAGEDRRELPRHGKREQREHPVGVDFQEALHGAPGLPGRHAAVENEQTAEAVAVNAKIGQRRRRTAGDRGTDQGMAGEEAGGDGLGVEGLSAAGEKSRMGRDHDLSGQRRHPLGRNGSDGGLGEGVLPGTRHDELVAGELGVPLPLEPKRPEIGAVVVGAGLGRGGAEALGQVAHLAPLRLAPGPVGEQGEKRHPRRRDERLGRTGVNLVVEFDALGMVGRKGHDGRREIRRPACMSGRRCLRGAPAAGARAGPSRGPIPSPSGALQFPDGSRRRDLDLDL
jgi:hypothetical protein